MQTRDHKWVAEQAKQAQERHNGYVQMYTNGDSVCLHCLEIDNKPIPMLGWTPGECDYDHDSQVDKEYCKCALCYDPKAN